MRTQLSGYLIGSIVFAFSATLLLPQPGCAQGSDDSPLRGAHRNQLCLDKYNRDLGGNWRHVGPGTGGARYNGTSSTACLTASYAKVSGSKIDWYRCPESYEKCTFSSSSDVNKVYTNKEGRRCYQYNKTYNALCFEGTAETDAAPMGTLIDPRGDAWKNQEEWVAWLDSIRDNYGGWVEHRIDPNGGDACLNGEAFALYDFRVGPDHRLIYDHMWNATINPLKQGDPTKSHSYNADALRLLSSSSATHCFKIHYPSTSTGFANFPRWYDHNRLHGTINSEHSGIRYEISQGRVTSHTALKACCDQEKRVCLGYVHADESCPQGSSMPGIRGDGSYTPCTICSESNPEPVKEEPPKEKPKPMVGCCYDRCVNVDTGVQCATSGGNPLEPERSCPASGRDPCLPPPPPDEPGACLLKDGSCKELRSPQACWDIPNFHMFMKGSACKVEKKGGCCDRETAQCTLTSYENCAGFFYSEGCPQQCPQQEGSCTVYCADSNTELCEVSYEDQCSQISGARFQKGGTCTFRSGTLDCPSPCSECANVIGAYDTDRGQYFFRQDCSGLVLQDNGKRFPFTYRCRYEKDIQILYSGAERPESWGLTTDGSHRRIFEW